MVVLLGGLAYVFYYLVTGAITYEFFTRDYYPDAAEQAREFGVWFWVMQIGRGAAMSLALVPFIRTLRMSRRATALAAGMLLWVAGGLAPLLIPNDLMTGTLRFIHIVEILVQNGPLGVTVALLLRPRADRGAPVTPQGFTSTVAVRHQGT